MGNDLRGLHNPDKTGVDGSLVTDKVSDLDTFRLLVDIYKELKIMNIHLANMTSETITGEDVG